MTNCCRSFNHFILQYIFITSCWRCLIHGYTSILFCLWMAFHHAPSKVHVRSVTHNANLEAPALRHLQNGRSMQSKMIERDILFVMLAKNKCMKAFQMLKSVHFPSPHTAAPEPIRDYWNLADEYNAPPWHRVCNRPNHCVLQLHGPMNKGGLRGACEQRSHLSLSHSGNPSGPFTLWRKATYQRRDPHKMFPICWAYLGLRRGRKRKTQSNSLERGCGQPGGKRTHLAWGGRLYVR